MIKDMTERETADEILAITRNLKNRVDAREFARLYLLGSGLSKEAREKILILLKESDERMWKGPKKSDGEEKIQGRSSNSWPWMYSKNYLKKRVVIDDFSGGYGIRCFANEELYTLSVEDHPHYSILRNHGNFFRMLILVGIWDKSILLGGKVPGLCWCGSKIHRCFSFAKGVETDDVWDTRNLYICPNCGQMGPIS